MRINHPIQPLSKVAFASALRTGHGRAIQHIQDHGSNGLEEIIIEACVTSVSYDPQLEAERAPWLFSIVDRAKLKADVVQAIRKAINTAPAESSRDSDQRSAILKELAASGSEDARRLLYSSLARSSNTADVIGAPEIVALDGVDGLIYVAKQMGQWMQADPDFWDDDSMIAGFDASTGIKAGLAALEREAALDSDIATYLAGIRDTRDGLNSSSTRFDAMSLKGDEVVAYVKKNPKDQCFWLRRWGTVANNDQREIVFAALVAAEESDHAKRLFRCFAITGLPQFEIRLLRWIEHVDAQVRWAAVAALARMTHVELRQVAMRLITGDSIANGVTLLVRNFLEGDFSRCAEHLSQLADADETHHLVGALLDLCEAHLGHNAQHCLLYVYEFSPCSTCRKRAVKALIDANTAPAWVLAESAFDADPETRAFVMAAHSFN